MRPGDRYEVAPVNRSECGASVHWANSRFLAQCKLHQEAHIESRACKIEAMRGVAVPGAVTIRAIVFYLDGVLIRSRMVPVNT
jgi:hypothetical protein